MRTSKRVITTHADRATRWGQKGQRAAERWGGGLWGARARFQKEAFTVAGLLETGERRERHMAPETFIASWDVESPLLHTRHCS